MKLAPKLMRRYQTECHGDLADEQQMQDYATDVDTAKLLVDEFHNIDKDSIVPAMMASATKRWLTNLNQKRTIRETIS